MTELTGGGSGIGSGLGGSTMSGFCSWVAHEI
jgi:hypothetical protein